MPNIVFLINTWIQIGIPMYVQDMFIYTIWPIAILNHVCLDNPKISEMPFMCGGRHISLQLKATTV